MEGGEGKEGVDVQEGLICLVMDEWDNGIVVEEEADRCSSETLCDYIHICRYGRTSFQATPRLCFVGP